MDKKDTKRIEKARQMSNELSKRERNKWKIKKELKEKKRIEELQNEEIDKINNKLEELREEFNRITRERGSAHKWAKIIEEQDFHMNSYKNRINLKVKNRAKNTLNVFLKENTIKENEIKINKEKEIMKRKQLMKSPLEKENIDKEDVNILRQLQKLENAEKVLRKLIDIKKELSHSESSIETNTKKLFWPKRLFSQQEFLYSNIDSIINVDQNEDQTDSKFNEINIRKDASIQTNNFENKVNSNEFNAISIAKQLYERLKSRQIINSSDDKNRKVYRNVAISTAQHLRSSDNMIHNFNVNDCSLPSSQTSYLSLPIPQQFSSNKATIGLSELYKNQLLNKTSNSVNSKSSISTINLDSNSFKNITSVEDTLDPLIARINRLKELINRKVEESSQSHSSFQNQNTSQSDILLSRGDCNRIGSKSKILNRLSIIEESDNNNLNLNNAIINDENELQKLKDSFRDRIDMRGENADQYIEESLSSSASFKTLQALTSSGRSSPFEDLVSDQSDHQNSDKSQTFSSLQLQELSSNTNYDSINSSVLNSEPIRDRNAFWREVFERAGIDINYNQIENFLQTHQYENEASLESLSISAFSNSLHSHSTPK